MLPLTLDQLLSLDHPAQFVARLVDALDTEGLAVIAGARITY